MIDVKFNGLRWELLEDHKRVVAKDFFFSEEAYHHARKYFGGHQTTVFNRDGTPKFFCWATKNEYIGIVSGERDLGDYEYEVSSIHER